MTLPFPGYSSLESKEGMRPLPSQILKKLEAIQVSKVHFHMSRSNRWRRPKQDTKTRGAKAAHKMKVEVEEKTDYSAWSQEKLVERVTQLEQELKNKNQRFAISNICFK